MVQLATTVFESGPKDVVSLVDVYNTVDTEVRNDLTSKLSSFGNNLTDVFSKGKESIMSLGSNLKKINLVDAKNRLEGLLKGSRSDLASLATNIQHGILRDIAGETNYAKMSGIANAVQIAIGQTSYVTNGNSNNIKSTLSFISDLTGNTVFNSLDLGAEAAFVRSIIGEVNSWGIPELVDELMRDKDQRYQYEVFKSASSSIMNTTNHKMLKHYIDKGYGSALMSDNPAFINNFLSSYTLPEGTTPEQYPTLNTELMAMLDKLDPNWLYKTRIVKVNGEEEEPVRVFNLERLSHVSEDAKLVFLSSSETIGAVTIAKDYRSASLIGLAREMYPMIAL